MSRCVIGPERESLEFSLSLSLRTLTSSSRMEIRVKGSRFIAIAWPVRSELEVQDRLVSLRAEHPDATHHCWGYRIVSGRVERERAHDAGEPHGTAGAPILQAIHAAGVGNVLVGVARYFGGTKLGRGGLARAYRDSARHALERAPIVEMVPQIDLIISGPLERDGSVRHLVARHGGTVTGSKYGEAGEAVLSVRLPSAGVPELTEALEDLTRGSWSLRPDD